MIHATITLFTGNNSTLPDLSVLSWHEQIAVALTKDFDLLLLMQVTCEFCKDTYNFGKEEVLEQVGLAANKPMKVVSEI